jgi:hypothetical protein
VAVLFSGFAWAAGSLYARYSEHHPNAVMAAAQQMIVGALALLAAVTGVCVGCWMYRFAAPFRGIRPGKTHWFDLAELGAPPGSEVVVEFTHPLCSECVELDERLSKSGRAVVRIDVSRQPELARKYRVSLVPLAYAVGADGTVLRRIA